MKIKLQDFRDTFQTIPFTANYTGLMTSCGEKNVPLLLNLYVSIFFNSNLKKKKGLNKASIMPNFLTSEPQSRWATPKTSLFNV